ncbi:MBL fold metallo-hydrolase [Erysipelothrix tonsillarum]|uniref:MBL fold metallo-hydrolase n=1 Tax=Erysipelothrix tonsillarum TaxID=38402 RepID=UPI00036B6013|nr:MBL fold metallo-hydrolase [Erysipelothrix tonsillarum]
MKVTYQTLGYAATNTYYLSEGTQMLIIDPCLDPNQDATTLLKPTEGFEVIGVLLTHGHFDHISGVDVIIDAFHCPLYMYHEEIHYLKDMSYNLSNQTPEPFIINAIPTAIDCEPLQVGPFECDVIKTAGHTSGSISYVFDDFIFDGDFIFERSIGRTDLPTGNMNVMNASLRSFIQDFGSVDYILYPGHGNPTTLYQEMKTNPYLKPNM